MKQPITRQFQEALDSYKEGYMVFQKLADGSRVEYETDVGQFLASLQERGIAEPQKVTYRHLAHYVAKLEHSGLAEATLRKKTVVLKTFFSWLCLKHFIVTDPAKAVIPKEREEKTPKILSTNECKALLTHIRHPRDAAIVKVLLYTGITLSEISRLRLSDLSDLNVSMRVTPGVLGKSHVTREETGTLHIREKGSRERAIPLNGDVVKVLITYLQKRPTTPYDALFLSKYRKPFSERWYQYIVERYLVRANIANAGVQTLRHTFAVNQLRQGVSSERLQELLGLKQARSLDPIMASFKAIFGENQGIDLGE
jgi:integrase/recombinase XerD